MIPDHAPQSIDVLAVAPHPDDLEITCGGALAKLVQQGKTVAMLDLTSGEPTPRGTFELRQQEAEAARVALGVPYRFNLNLPNRVLMDSPENRFALGTAFRKLRPSVVIVMAGRTPAASPDHHQGHMLVEASRFYSQLTKWDDRFAGTSPYRVPHLVYAVIPFDAEQRQWHGSFILDVSDVYEKKLASIRCYGSQFDEPRLKKLEHFLKAHNAYLGGRCGFMYGEQYALPTPIGSKDFMTTVQGGAASSAPVQLPGKDHLPLG
ncbi:MAG: PIG-L family deacetylase [Planctomycetia bacterium]|nr:PIG-L family deacetylase [Planctomycetia bacterium]